MPSIIAISKATINKTKRNAANALNCESTNVKTYASKITTNTVTIKPMIAPRSGNYISPFDNMPLKSLLVLSLLVFLFLQVFIKISLKSALRRNSIYIEKRERLHE